MPRALILLVVSLSFLAPSPLHGLGVPAAVWVLTGPTEPVKAGVPFLVRAEVRLPAGYYQDADSPFLELEPNPPAVVTSRGHSPPQTRGTKTSFVGTFTLERSILMPVGTREGPLSLVFRTGSQICQVDGVCLLPVEETRAISLVVEARQSVDLSAFWAALATAFLGGLLLNLMPCVFPVLALKALALAGSASQLVSSRRREALLFAAGSFTVVLGLGAGAGLAAWAGQRLEWGFAFQQPLFVWLLIVAFALMTLQLWGLVPTGWSLFSIRVPVNHGRARSFLAGAFFVIAAAPCTAPLLGPALGFAFSQPPPQIPLFFGAIGLGLVFPLLVLQLLPRWGRYLPPPGPWMVWFERAAGTLLSATVVYLLWVFGVQNGVANGWLAAFALLLATLGYILWASKARRWRRTLGAGLLLAVLGAPWVLAAVGQTPGKVELAPGWSSYSSETLASALAEGRPVLVDATAAWCATCQVNELAVLHRSDVNALLSRLNVVLLRADYTSPNPEVKAWLASVERAGLPVYALYRPDQPVYLFPELLTDGNFTDRLPGLLTR